MDHVQCLPAIPHCLLAPLFLSPSCHTSCVPPTVISMLVVWRLTRTDWDGQEEEEHVGTSGVAGGGAPKQCALCKDKAPKEELYGPYKSDMFKSGICMHPHCLAWTPAVSKSQGVNRGHLSPFPSRHFPYQKGLL